MQKEWPDTDFTKSSIHPDEILYQALPKDAIPSIDSPVFKSINEIGWIQPGEPIIVVQYANTAKAYPLQIMIHHEIVNDNINGKPIAVTFCPLCNASIVYERTIQGEVLDFGVSGSLRKSDLIMYDRQSQSWWQQFTGVGIVGKYDKVKLNTVASQVIAYRDFVKSYPQGKVLSRETGYNKQYGENPFRGYDDIDESPFLFFDAKDKRLPAMERVLAVSIGDKHRVYPLSHLRKQKIINDNFAGMSVVVFSKHGMLSAVDKQWIEDSRTIPAAVAYNRRYNNRLLSFTMDNGRIRDRQTNSSWNILGLATAGKLKGARLSAIDNGVHFAFAWLAFRPESEIFTEKK